jgi:hypothetical protein
MPHPFHGDFTGAIGQSLSASYGIKRASNFRFYCSSLPENHFALFKTHWTTQNPGIEVHKISLKGEEFVSFAGPPAIDRDQADRFRARAAGRTNRGETRRAAG